MRNLFYNSVFFTFLALTITVVATFCWGLVWADAAAGVPLFIGCVMWVARDVWRDVLGGKK